MRSKVLNWGNAQCGDGIKDGGTLNAGMAMGYAQSGVGKGRELKGLLEDQQALATSYLNCQAKLPAFGQYSPMLVLEKHRFQIRWGLTPLAVRASVLIPLVRTAYKYCLCCGSLRRCIPNLRFWEFFFEGRYQDTCIIFSAIRYFWRAYSHSKAPLWLP